MRCDGDAHAMRRDECNESRAGGRRGIRENREAGELSARGHGQVRCRHERGWEDAKPEARRRVRVRRARPAAREGAVPEANLVPPFRAVCSVQSARDA